MRLITDCIDYFCFIMSASQIGLLFIKYTITQAYRYPFMGLLIMSAPLALAGIFTTLKLVVNFKGRGPIFYLDISEQVFLGVLYGFGQVVSVCALQYTELTLLRFFVITAATECILLPLLSWLFLGRSIYAHYILTLMFSVIAIVLHDVININRLPPNLTLSVSVLPNWQSPLLAALAKTLHLLGSVLSKRFILQRAHQNKLKQSKLHRRERMKEKEKIF